LESKYILVVVILIASLVGNVYVFDKNVTLEKEIEDQKSILSEKESEIYALQVVVNDLNDTITTLKTEVSTLNYENYERLEQADERSDEGASLTAILEHQTEQIEELNHQVSELQVQVYDLETEKSNIEHDYALLQSSHVSLSELILELQETLRLENDLRIGNTLASYFDTVRYGEGYFESQNLWVNYLKSLWQSNIDFAAKLARHDLHRYTWNSYETSYEKAVGENSYETAWFKLQRIRTYLDIYPSDSSATKVKKILAFITENIHYEEEVNNIFLAPVETLGFKSGDCDDFSILAATLFECENIESAIGFFRNDVGDYHAMVLIRMDNLAGYSRYYGYEDLTDYGLGEGWWTLIEPQNPIELQGEIAWMTQWSLDVVADVEN